MFELDQFIADCRAALAADKSHKLMREVVARAVSQPASVMRALGEPTRSGIHKLYHAPDLTILNLVWAPMMTVTPHDHRMWAVIGIYAGREDNIFWRRIPGDPGGRIEAVGARGLCVGDAEPLGENIIHSVTNPIQQLTSAIHVYGGDFFAADRSEWDAESLREGHYDAERTLRRFEEANSTLVTRAVRAGPCSSGTKGPRRSSVPSVACAKVFRFDRYTLDLARASVRCGEEDIELRPKSFDVLQYLVENAGRVVSKDEILGEVWSRVIVTDDSLVQCIRDIRQALKDDAQRLIKTMPRRGYMFDVPVLRAHPAYGPTCPTHQVA